MLSVYYVFILSLDNILFTEISQLEFLPHKSGTLLALKLKKKIWNWLRIEVQKLKL